MVAHKQSKNQSKANYIHLATLLLEQKNPYIEVQKEQKDRCEFVVYNDVKKKKKIFSFTFVKDEKCKATLSDGETLEIDTVKGTIFARKLLQMHDAPELVPSVRKKLQKETTNKLSLFLETVAEAMRR